MRKRREKVGRQGCPDPTDSGRIHGVSELCSKEQDLGCGRTYLATPYYNVLKLAIISVIC